MNARNWVPLGDTVNNANVIQSTSSMKEEIISVQSVQQKQNFSTLEKTNDNLPHLRLAKKNRVTIVSEYGRRVIGSVVPE